MTKKSMMFSIVLAASSAILAAGLAVYGSHLFPPTVYMDGSERSESSEANITMTESEIHFVDIKNIVITLTSNGRVNHYLLLDLAVTTETQEQAEKVGSSIALIKSSTVNLLTNMDYDGLSAMHVSELRQLLLDEYRKAYTSLNLKVPFNDIMISKMVFQ